MKKGHQTVHTYIHKITSMLMNDDDIQQQQQQKKNDVPYKNNIKLHL